MARAATITWSSAVHHSPDERVRRGRKSVSSRCGDDASTRYRSTVTAWAWRRHAASPRVLTTRTSAFRPVRQPNCALGLPASPWLPVSSRNRPSRKCQLRCRATHRPRYCLCRQQAGLPHHPLHCGAGRQRRSSYLRIANIRRCLLLRIRWRTHRLMTSDALALTFVAVQRHSAPADQEAPPADGNASSLYEQLPAGVGLSRLSVARRYGKPWRRWKSECVVRPPNRP